MPFQHAGNSQQTYGFHIVEHIVTVQDLLKNFCKVNIISGPNWSQPALLLVSKNFASASPIWPSLNSAGENDSKNTFSHITYSVVHIGMQYTVI